MLAPLPMCQWPPAANRARSPGHAPLIAGQCYLAIWRGHILTTYPVSILPGCPVLSLSFCLILNVRDVRGSTGCGRLNIEGGNRNVGVYAGIASSAHFVCCLLGGIGILPDADPGTPAQGPGSSSPPAGDGCHYAAVGAGHGAEWRDRFYHG